MSDEYHTLLEAAFDNPEACDFTALREAFARSPDFNPLALLNNDLDDLEMDEEEGSARIDRKLALNFLSPDTHLEAAQYYEELGDEGLVAFHRFFFAGIIRSVLDSGEGTSPQSPFKVISVEEEYAAAAVLRLTVLSQGATTIGQNHFDRFECVDESGERRELYFNTDMIFAGYGRGI